MLFFLLLMPFFVIFLFPFPNLVTLVPRFMIRIHLRMPLLMRILAGMIFFRSFTRGGSRRERGRGGCVLPIMIIIPVIILPVTLLTMVIILSVSLLLVITLRTFMTM